MLSSRSTYASAFAACGLLFVLAPPAGLLMTCFVMANMVDELSTSPPEAWKTAPPRVIAERDEQDRVT